MLQSEALNILKMGKNVFLTGAAGSGKTFVLNSYVEYLKKHAVDVAVTASTGIAATHLGGMTIHSWSGLGIRDSLTEYDLEDLMEKQYLYKRFSKTKILIIDEVSMLHGFRLDLVDLVCRKMKMDDRPFGGMQIILCGDFFQLPPINRGETIDVNFIFKSKSFINSNFVICYLEEQYRQKDKEYLSILNQIRDNRVTSRTMDLLKSRLLSDLEENEYTRLFTHNVDVDLVNNKYLSLIDGEIKKYQMKSTGSNNLAEALRKSCLSPEELLLKAGSKVMFTKNHPEGQYVNGTLGEILRFNSFGDPIVVTKNGLEIVVSPASWKIEEEGKVKAEISQLPLRLAWAITVHKSQGMSLDSMEVDLSKSFVRGMGYVALSRVRSLDGLRLLGFNQMALEVDSEVLEMDKRFRDLSSKVKNDLEKISKKEMEDLHKAWIKKIEPEEKVRIKKKEKETKLSTHDLTRRMLEEEMSLSTIAKDRGIKEETVISHIEDMIRDGDAPDILYLKRELKRSELDEMLDAFKDLETTTLSPVYNYLLRKKKKPQFTKLRLARLFL